LIADPRRDNEELDTVLARLRTLYQRIESFQTA
jgi:hypothetical protein